MKKQIIISVIAISISTAAYSTPFSYFAEKWGSLCKDWQSYVERTKYLVSLEKSIKYCKENKFDKRVCFRIAQYLMNDKELEELLKGKITLDKATKNKYYKDGLEIMEIVTAPFDQPTQEELITVEETTRMSEIKTDIQYSALALHYLRTNSNDTFAKQITRRSLYPAEYQRIFTETTNKCAKFPFYTNTNDEKAFGLNCNQCANALEKSSNNYFFYQSEEQKKWKNLANRIRTNIRNIEELERVKPQETSTQK